MPRSQKSKFSAQIRIISGEKDELTERTKELISENSGLSKKIEDLGKENRCSAVQRCNDDHGHSELTTLMLV